MNITEFLLARIAEDEAGALSASPGGWHYGSVESVAGGMLYDETRTIASVHYEQPEDHDGQIVRHLLSPEADANGRHIARHDPARVLAECEAKRRIIERLHRLADAGYPGEWPPVDDAVPDVLCLLAQPYADHPDYDPNRAA